MYTKTFLGGCYKTRSCDSDDYEKFDKEFPGNRYYQCCETSEINFYLFNLKYFCETSEIIFAVLKQIVLIFFCYCKTGSLANLFKI